MPKQVLQVTDFSGGLNAYKDARDIKDNEFIQNWNFMVDKAGIIRMGGQVENHINTEFLMKILILGLDYFSLM